MSVGFYSGWAFGALPGPLVVNGDVTIEGTTTSILTAELVVEDKLITLNSGGLANTGFSAGFEIEENAVKTGYIKSAASGSEDKWLLKAPDGNILTLDVNADKTVTIAGALNVEADSNINQDLSSDSTTAGFGKQSLTVAGIGATGQLISATPALLVTNTTAAVAGPGVTVQVSPDVRLVGHAWETATGTDDTHTWAIRVVPATGATSTSVLSLLTAIDAGVLTERFNFSNGGNFSATGNVLAGSLVRAATNQYMWPNLSVNGTSCNTFYSTSTSLPCALFSYVANGAAAIGHIIDIGTAFTTEGAKIVSVRNVGVEKAYIDKDGGIACPGGKLTAATMTETSVANIKQMVSKYSWTNAMVVALGAVGAGDIKVCTLPAKTVVKNAYIVIDSAATNMGAATLTVSFGRTGATYLDYIGNSDAKAAANTVYGDAVGERGANLTGYDLPSYTAATDVYCHFITDGAGGKTLADAQTCTGSVFIETVTLP